jgi:hypothetical protein
MLTFHNPSGHTAEAGIATLPAHTFDRRKMPQENAAGAARP